MNVAVGRSIAVGRNVVAQVREKNLSFVAGSLAYYAFVSLIPLLLLLLVVTAFLGGEQFAQQVIDQTQAYLTPEAQELVEQAISDQRGAGSLSVIGFVVLVWGTLKILRALDTAFSQVYGTTGKQSLLEQIGDGLVTLAAIGVAIVATVAAGAAFVFLDVPFIGVLSPVLLIVGLTVAFVPMYYLFPDVDLRLRSAIPGAIVAAVGWTLLQVGFQVYAATAGQDAYGALGAVVMLVTWLYFGGFIILIGAVVNAVLTGHAGRPAPGDARAGIPAVDQDRAERPPEPPAEVAEEPAPAAAGTGRIRDFETGPVGPEATEEASAPTAGVRTPDADVEVANGEGAGRLARLAPYAAIGVGLLLTAVGVLLGLRRRA